MADTKHPAVESAEWLEASRFGRTSREGDKDRFAAMLLRTIPALEASNRTLHINLDLTQCLCDSWEGMYKNLTVMIEHLQEERDKLRVEIERWACAAAVFEHERDELRIGGASLIEAFSALLSYTKACEGLLKWPPAGQVTNAEYILSEARKSDD